jgi:NADH:ubiquinone oxidoreductase subunit 6 (subunit J)
MFFYTDWLQNLIIHTKYYKNVSNWLSLSFLIDLIISYILLVKTNSKDSFPKSLIKNISNFNNYSYMYSFSV